jgi:hypothetical protein
MPLVVRLAASCSRALRSCSQNKCDEFSSDFKVDFNFSDEYTVYQMHIRVRYLKMLHCMRQVGYTALHNDYHKICKYTFIN